MRLLTNSASVKWLAAFHKVTWSHAIDAQPIGFQGSHLVVMIRGFELWTDIEWMLFGLTEDTVAVCVSTCSKRCYRLSGREILLGRRARFINE